MESLAISALSPAGWITLAVVASLFGLLMFTRFPADFLFLGALAILLITGIVDPTAGLAGFGSSGLVTIGVLYVVVAGLQETGGLSWITQHVLGAPRGLRAAVARLMAPVMAMSAFLNNTPVVAMFIPAVTEWSRRIRIPPSKLLIPLSYASILGGMCTLIGTSTNLVVDGLYQKRFGLGGLPIFEITKLGIPCAAVGFLFVVLAARRLLPERKSLDEVFENTREYTLELEVSPGSPLIGRSIEEAGLSQVPGAFLAELIRGDHVFSVVSPGEVLREGDRLVFVGHIESIRSLYHQKGLQPAPDQLFKLDAPRHKRILVEAVVSNTCPLIGKSIRDGRFRNVYNAVVIAVARNGERLRGRLEDIVLRPGDTLLVEAHAGFIPRQRDSRDFYLIRSLDDTAPRRFEKAPLALAILAGMICAAALDWMTMLNAAIAAAMLMVMTGCCSIGQARRSVEWNVLTVIGAAIGLGTAMEQTGAARAITNLLLGFSGSDPWMTLAFVYLATTLVTEVITNNGAAALVFPVAMDAAARLGVNPLPYVFCVMIAASASFATPIGYQTNLMVLGPGGYRFGDYVRIGFWLNLIIGAAAVALAPLIWPF
ncbi:MAG: SLC13 family permease [Kiritimatiellae bacterium]|nr:SLC13 family permease [Kiritimatiellia bacterium]MDW8459032.1 SLC13 family permease [Verrucomicrobiota bacterium]